MGNVLISNIDDRTLERLRIHAAAERKTVEEAALAILKRAVTTDRTAALVEMDRIRAMTGGRLERDSADMIREDRDTR